MAIKDSHIPAKALITDSRTEVPYYLEKADELWNMMIDKGSREIPMTHQGYLKLYQLSEPLPDNQYDCWLCDEVQNATPVMVDIVLRQKGRSKILAGDPHQQVWFCFKDLNVQDCPKVRVLCLKNINYVIICMSAT